MALQLDISKLVQVFNDHNPTSMILKRPMDSEHSFPWAWENASFLAQVLSFFDPNPLQKSLQKPWVTRYTALTPLCHINMFLDGSGSSFKENMSHVTKFSRCIICCWFERRSLNNVSVNLWLSLSQGLVAHLCNSKNYLVLKDMIRRSL